MITGKLISTAVGIACFTLSTAAMAQPEKKGGSNSSPAARAQSLEPSKKVKFKDKTSVDFDDANIDGSVKNPFGSIIQSRDQGFDKGFIKIRYNWHDQMVMSLSGLSGN
jgi:hypothetical protein